MQPTQVPRKVRELGRAGGEGVVGMCSVNNSSLLLGHNDGKMEVRLILHSTIRNPPGHTRLPRPFRSPPSPHLSLTCLVFVLVGLPQLCALEGEGVETWQVRGPVSCLGVHGNLLVASGKERDLALWDLEKMGGMGEEVPLWEAKNVKHDKLDLRLPVWGTALTFLDSPHVVAVGTAYKQLRVYDTRVQRRPLRSMDLETKVIETHRVTAITGATPCSLSDSLSWSGC